MYGLCGLDQGLSDASQPYEDVRAAGSAQSGCIQP
jgi:hypothetical protein